MSRHQKGKTNLDFTEARDSEWQWHQLGHMQVCTLFQTDNHASTPPLSFFTGRMPFLPPNQQHQSTEGTVHDINHTYISVNTQNSCPLNASLCYATYICPSLLEQSVKNSCPLGSERQQVCYCECMLGDRRTDRRHTISQTLHHILYRQWATILFR